MRPAENTGVRSSDQGGTGGYNPTSLTSVRVSCLGFIFVNQGLDLILTQTWEKFLVQPGISLFLVQELGEDLLRHGGFRGAVEENRASDDHIISAAT